MKKVFITGISGMLGSNLAFNLKEYTNTLCSYGEC